MRQLYDEYTQLTNNKPTNVKQLVSHLANTNVKQAISHLVKPNSKQIVNDLNKVKQLVSKVPWGQNILILQMVKELKQGYFISKLLYKTDGAGQH
jgi:pyruvate-formate lyase-activating enzyme